MNKSLLHGLVAVLAAAVLLLQHMPLVQTGHGYDEHCIHCTTNFCTKDACYCDHKHSHKEHAAGPAPASGPAAGHSVDHSHGGGEYGHHTAVGTTIKPCGAPPSGIITLSLDKFVAGISAAVSPRETERPSSARYVGLSDQLIVRPIFHPPALG